MKLDDTNTRANEKLVWYRSTWLTFPLIAADFIATGSAKKKNRALRCFMSQWKMALGNVISFSALEAKTYGLRAKSIEAFRYASSGTVTASPINVLSVTALRQLRRWQ